MKCWYIEKYYTVPHSRRQHSSYSLRHENCKYQAEIGFQDQFPRCITTDSYRYNVLHSTVTMAATRNIKIESPRDGEAIIHQKAECIGTASHNQGRGFLSVPMELGWSRPWVLAQVCKKILPKFLSPRTKNHHNPSTSSVCVCVCTLSVLEHHLTDFHETWDDPYSTTAKHRDQF